MNLQAWKWYQPLNNGEFTPASAGFACSLALCCNWSLPHSAGRREFQSWALTSPASLGEILLPTRKQGTGDSHLLLRPSSSHWGQTLADHVVPGWELLMQQTPTQATRDKGAAFALSSRLLLKSPHDFCLQLTLLLSRFSVCNIFQHRKHACRRDYNFTHWLLVEVAVRNPYWSVVSPYTFSLSCMWPNWLISWSCQHPSVRARSRTNAQMWTGDMAPSGKCLPSKREDPSLIPRTHINKAGSGGAHF